MSRKKRDQNKKLKTEKVNLRYLYGKSFFVLSTDCISNSSPGLA